MADKKYTHVAVEPRTQRKVAILAKAKDVKIYHLMEALADREWKKALQAGLVTDAMLDTASRNTKAG